MLSVSELLDSIEASLRRLGAPVTGQLDQPQPFVAPPDVTAPPEVVEFFSWRGGTRRGEGEAVGTSWFIPGYVYPSAAEASDHRRRLGDIGIPGPWLPILISGGGDCFAAVWDRLDSVQVAGILLGEPPEIEFPSIRAFLSTCVEAFETGAFERGPAGHLVMEPDRFDEIADRVRRESGWPGPMTPLINDLLEETRALMVDLFGISQAEAAGRIESVLGGLDLLAPATEAYLGHEEASYWARTIYYEPGVSWWLQDQTELRPRSWPDASA